MSRKIVYLAAAAGLLMHAGAWAGPEDAHVRVTLSVNGSVIGGDHVLDVTGQKFDTIHGEVPAPYKKSFRGSPEPIVVNAAESYMASAGVQYIPDILDTTDPKGDHAFYRGPALFIHGYAAADQVKPETERTTSDYQDDIRISSKAFEIELSEVKPKYEEKIGPGVVLKIEWLNPEHQTRLATTTYRPGQAPVANP